MKDLRKNLEKIQYHLNTKDQKNISKNLKEKKLKEIGEGIKTTECKFCNDLGWISLKDDNYKYVVCNKCEKESGDRNKYEDYVNNKDLGDITLSMLKKMTFKNFKTAQQDSNLSDAKIASTNFSNDPKGWLLLTGATGVGKTHLAVAIAGNRIRDFKSIYFGFLPNILEKLRNFNNNQPDNYFNFLVEHPFLIIDDLGSQTNTTWAEEKIYQLIVSRHNNALPTVITTRATELKDELTFSPHIKDAILSRLIDRKLVDQHLMSAKDFRV